MRALAFFALAALAPAAAAAAPAGASLPLCTAPTSADSGPHEPLRDADEGDGTLAEVEAEFERMYATSKRLTRRGYWDGASFLSGADGVTRAPARFLENVRRHVEGALSAGYARWVMWEDMGHGHVYASRQTWERVAGLEQAARREALMADPGTLVLYHVAENVRLDLDDPAQRRRFFERNIVGDNRDGAVRVLAEWDGGRVNTVRSIPGHVEVLDALFYLRAHRDGCFAYRDGERAVRYDVRF